MINRLKKNLEIILENTPEQVRPLVPGSIALQAQKLFNLEYVNKSRGKFRKYSLELVRGVSLVGEGLTLLFSLSAFSGLGERESAPAELGLQVAMRYLLYMGGQYIRYRKT